MSARMLWSVDANRPRESLTALTGFSAACWRWNAANRLGGGSDRRLAASSSPSMSSRYATMTIGSGLGGSTGIDDDAVGGDDLRERSKRKLEAIEFAPRDRKQLDPLGMDVAQALPDRDDVEVFFRRCVREDRHQVPVAVGPVRSARAATEKPDLEGRSSSTMRVMKCGGTASAGWVVSWTTPGS